MLCGTFRDEHGYLVLRKVHSVILEGIISTGYHKCDTFRDELSEYIGVVRVSGTFSDLNWYLNIMVCGTFVCYAHYQSELNDHHQ